MKIQTTRFGEVEIKDSLIFDFVGPILSYEQYKFYTIIEHSSKSPFKWLQSTENPELAFAVTTPSSFNLDYEFEITDEVVELLGIDSIDDVLILNIANISGSSPKQSTLNLLAPIIINIKTKKGTQFILENSPFPIKYQLFKD